jgi:hypothetical protein
MLPGPIFIRRDIGGRFEASPAGFRNERKTKPPSLEEAQDNVHLKSFDARQRLLIRPLVPPQPITPLLPSLGALGSQQDGASRAPLRVQLTATASLVKWAKHPTYTTLQP